MWEDGRTRVITARQAGGTVDAETGGWRFAEDQNIGVLLESFHKALTERKREDGVLTVEKSGSRPLSGDQG